MESTTMLWILLIGCICFGFLVMLAGIVSSKNNVIPAAIGVAFFFLMCYFAIRIYEYILLNSLARLGL